MNIDYLTLLIVDIFVFIWCSHILVRYGRLSAMHPATTYLAFHFYVVTFRLIGLLLGAQTLKMTGADIAADEILRAALLADVALVSMTTAWVKVSLSDLRLNGPMPEPGNEPFRNLTKKYFWLAALITFPIGLYGLQSFGYAAGPNQVDVGEWQSSTYLSMTVTWSFFSVLILIYIYGFNKVTIGPALIFLLIMVINTPRYVIVVSVIYLSFVYLSMNGQRWFSKKMVGILLLVMIVWFPLKVIANGIRMGYGVETIVADSIKYSKMALLEGGEDTAFLDMAAGIITQIDRHGEFFYGEAWYPILVSPIPRQLWPGKPRMNEYLWTISTPDRPFNEFGLVPTLLGDAYLNFGYVGVVLIPYSVAYFYALGYFKAFRRNHYSTTRFLYLIFAFNLIQVYRDGVVSILHFVLINSMPLMLVVYMHWLFPRLPDLTVYANEAAE